MLTIRGRHTGETACRVSRWHDEDWVHAAVIEGLLAIGYTSTEIRYEFLLEPGSRCDVVAITETSVLVVECKREERFVGQTSVRQTRRYAEAAARRWPDRDVTAFLVWGSRFPVRSDADLGALAVA